MTKKEPKHPKHMTTQEAAEHLFHPKVLEHAKKSLEHPPKSTKKSS